MQTRNYELRMMTLGKNTLLDKYGDMSERGGVENLADVIAAVLTEHGISQSSLARALGEKQQTISKWVSGSREPKLDDIMAIEDHLGLLHGTILRRSGYVDDVVTVGQAIEIDLTLDKDARDAMRAVYRGVSRP